MVQLSGALLAQASFSPLPQLTEGAGELVGQWLRAEATSCPVPGEKMLGAAGTLEPTAWTARSLSADARTRLGELFED